MSLINTTDGLAIIEDDPVLKGAVAGERSRSVGRSVRAMARKEYARAAPNATGHAASPFVDDYHGEG